MLQRLQNRWNKLMRFAKRYPSAALISLLIIAGALISFTQGVGAVWFVAFKLAPILLLLCFVRMMLSPLSPFTRLGNLALQLGDPDERERYQAFEELLQEGDKATPIFVYVLSEAPYENFEGWVSVYAHCLAAEGLGRLRAREGVDALMEAVRSLDPDITATAIWALAQIGDERAVKAIVPLLTRKSRLERQKWLNDWAKELLEANGQITLPHSGTVGAIASAALVQLGQADLVNAFWKAWKERDESAIKQLKTMKEFRKEVTDALVMALNTGTVSEAINAAQLLGELWAFDALPALKSKAKALSTPEKVREVCLEVIAKLEQLSRLPMPATASEIDTSTLPRPASVSEIATDTLPSPANPPQNSGG